MMIFGFVTFGVLDSMGLTDIEQPTIKNMFHRKLNRIIQIEVIQQ